MIDIYNEIAYIKNILQDGFSSKWERDVKLLTRYYKMEGMKKREAKELIRNKCMHNNGKFSFDGNTKDITRMGSIFEKAWKSKEPLREISKVEISKEVLDWFLSLETDFVISDEEQERLKKRRPNVSIKNNRPVNWKRTKYLFTLYIWTKIQENYLDRPYMHYLSNYTKRFKEDADLKQSFSLSNERNLLYDLKFIKVNYALGVEASFIKDFDVFNIPITDENRIVIELYKDGKMKDDDGKLISEEEGDLHHCGYWLEKQKMGSFVCKRCGKETAYYSKNRQEHCRRYCKECANKLQVSKSGAHLGEATKIDRFCIGCGVKIHILNPNDFKTCRCEKCQKEETKKNKLAYYYRQK